MCIKWETFNAIIARTSTLFSFSVNFAGLAYPEQGLKIKMTLLFESCDWLKVLDVFSFLRLFLRVSKLSLISLKIILF